MILIIDNYDSFTYNLYQQVESLGFQTKVITNNECSLKQIRECKPEKIIISPGPKRPESAGISSSVIKHFYKETPILGVCLGHQCIAQLFGAKVIYANKIMHGKVSPLFHNGSGLFEDVPSPFQAARYHSLIIDSIPKNFELTAWTESQSIMGIKHTQYPLFGIQFHPESFLTPEGSKIMNHFLHAS